MLDLADGCAEVILELHFPYHSIGALKWCPATPIVRAGPINDEHVFFSMSIGVQSLVGPEVLNLELEWLPGQL
jgi:hypothetical protein